MTNRQGDRPRDSQREKVYTAERIVFGGGRQPEFQTVAECQAFIDRLTGQATVRNHFPRLGRRVGANWHGHVVLVERPNQGQRRAIAYPAEWRMTVPVWARSRWVLCHELAHLVGPQDGAWHGWEFCDAYLWLVGRAIGADAKAELAAGFKSTRARWRPKRQMSDAQKAAAAARLAQYRKPATPATDVAADYWPPALPALAVG